MMPTDPAPRTLSPFTTGALALALAVAFAIVLPLMRPVLPVDETRYLSVAWEMHRDGTFIVPHLNGEIYAHKPPLLFWLINLIWSVTGVSEVAARLVAPAFGILSVALTWRLGNRLFPERPELGATAALILATTGIFGLYGSLTMFDTMLAAATLLGILALLRMDAGGGRLATLGLGAALAFGVLAKGPVILVHLLPLALSRAVPSGLEPFGRPRSPRCLVRPFGHRHRRSAGFACDLACARTLAGRGRVSGRGAVAPKRGADGERLRPCPAGLVLRGRLAAASLALGLEDHGPQGLGSGFALA
ncbi:MAG: glycosyltransferase family 39 protein [Rhodobacterales bacterium]|nr:glycosyltransferase family 39 protein [Rhodobacterales bacterium]